jgi:hypothetical protein
LFDHDRPSKQLERRGDAEHLDTRVVRIFERGRPGVLLAVDEPHEGLRREIIAARDARLLVRVPMRDQLAVCRDHEGVSLLADANLIDHPPHFFEIEFAGQPAGRLVEVGQPDRKRRGREQLVIDPDRRHQHAVDADGAAEAVHVDPRLADAARHQRGAVLGKQSDLAELPELEDVVLEDLILLAAIEAGVLEVGGERLEQVGVRHDVTADLFGGAGGDVLVAGDDGIVSALLQRQN